jgi:phage terminase large subunit GpA-like protein
VTKPSAAAVLEALPLAAAAARRRQEQRVSHIETLPTTILEWADRYRRIDGQAFSLDRFKPLRAIYEDTHPHIVVGKPAQRGVSEMAVNYTSFALDRGAAIWTGGTKDGLNVGYIFPTREALGDFSKERITGLMSEGPYLQQLFSGDDDFNAITFKQIGRSYLYLRGGWSEAALLSFPADVLILDEFDRMDPKAVALARRRMNASLVRRELDISTPTIPGRGIHAMYLQSDRRVYRQRCIACGELVGYDFFRDVHADDRPYDIWRTWTPERLRRADLRLWCPACHHEVSEAERCADGEWIAEAPEVTGLRGYWIPWWPFPVVDLAAYAITAISHGPSEVTEFYRSDLGAPYEPSGSRITVTMLGQLSHRLPGGVLPDGAYRDPTMGVDVGSRFHYRVSGLDQDGRVTVVAMGAVDAWDDLDRLMELHHVRQCVIDALPELHQAQTWAEKHPGRVLRSFYPTASALKGQLFRVDADAGVVQINRTMAMDRVYARISKAEENWPAAIHNDPEVVTHLTAPVRTVAIDAHGQEFPSWVHTAPDHGFHATVYDVLARETLEPEHLFQPAAGGSRPMLSQLDQLGQRRPFGQGPDGLRRGPPRERGY